jgi:flagellar biosynthesis chaperone FliJ
MNESALRLFVRSIITEAKENGALPKSGGKLVHLKKELAGLKKMKESLGQLQIAEGSDQSFVAEYAHMQKFVTELEKIKAAHAKLAEMLDKQINEVEGKVSSETEKIKEMVGLIEKAAKPKEKKEKKGDAKSKHEKGESKEEEKEEHKAEPKKRVKELEESFESVEKKIEKSGKSKEAATKIAGAIANAKMHGAGKGPTAKQKARLKESGVISGGFEYFNNFEEWKKAMEEKHPHIVSIPAAKIVDPKTGSIYYEAENRIYGRWDPQHPGVINGMKYVGSVNVKTSGSNTSSPNYSYTGYHGD